MAIDDSRAGTAVASTSAGPADSAADLDAILPASPASSSVASSSLDNQQHTGYRFANQDYGVYGGYAVDEDEYGYAPPRENKRNKRRLSARQKQKKKIKRKSSRGSQQQQQPQQQTSGCSGGNRSESNVFLREHTFLRRKPATITCPNCLRAVETIVERSTTTATHLSALLLVPLCLCALPYFSKALRNSRHRCPTCGICLGSKFASPRDAFVLCLGKREARSRDTACTSTL